MAPQRLRWIADYLDVADRAISVVACAQGVDYPSDLHRSAQRDLRRLAHWLEVRPDVAASLGVAMVAAVPDDITEEGTAMRRSASAPRSVSIVPPVDDDGPPVVVPYHESTNRPSEEAVG